MELFLECSEQLRESGVTGGISWAYASVYSLSRQQWGPAGDQPESQELDWERDQVEPAFQATSKGFGKELGEICYGSVGLSRDKSAGSRWPWNPRTELLGAVILWTVFTCAGSWGGSLRIE